MTDFSTTGFSTNLKEENTAAGTVVTKRAVAIITARGGSKRIPRKNIRNFCGKPILCYSIQAALDSGVFDEVMVSTEDEEIARIARECGAAVPFMRSSRMANDYASTDEVIDEVLAAYREQGVSFSLFCCIYPTAPFVTADKLRCAMQLLDQAESVMPVVAFSYPPQRGVVLEGGRICRKYPEFLTARSQDLEKMYHDCGQFYACRTDAFLRNHTTDVDDLVPMILPEMEVQDIDTEEDWEIAELKYRKMVQEAEAKEKRELKTPYFHIEETGLDTDVSLLKTALKENWGSNWLVGYSVKTNSLPWLLSYMKEQGFYAEIVSDTEYRLAKKLGFSNRQMIYNGPIKDREIFEQLLLEGGLVNLDSSQEPEWLEDLSRRFPDHSFSVGVRVNCDIAALCPEEELVDEEGGRFGYCYENGKLGEVIRRLGKLPNVKLAGLHLHSSTQSRTVYVYAALARMAVRIAEEYGLSLSYVDMGGGYFGGRDDKPGYREYFPAICRELGKKFDPEKTTLIAEPGVSLISRATTFVTTVRDIKEIRDHIFLVTDGSRTNLNPLVTRHVYPHHLEYVDDPQTRPVLPTQWVTGFTCMEYDRLFEIKDGPALKIGDKIIYDTAGGYTMCLNPLFIHYLPPVYVTRRDSSLFQARKQWDVEEYVQKNYIEGGCL